MLQATIYPYLLTGPGGAQYHFFKRNIAGIIVGVLISSQEYESLDTLGAGVGLRVWDLC